MKTLIREVAFGKAVARITVDMEETTKRVEGFEGIDLGTEVETDVKIEIVAPNGKVVTKDKVATAVGYGLSWDNRFEHGGFDKTKKITIVGSASTADENVAHEINRAIKEMKEELSANFETKTNEQIENEKEETENIEIAQEVVELAEKEGIENLMTAEQVRKWKINYNNMHNEGGEGYVPTRISKERYQSALKTLEGVAQ